ncbi:Holliday junction resolvase RuvX [Candidatus Saccharibacteria bacterium]|nr:Holliday junction resolvase RuvX [Candidatus Saccharibacteria bacterium]
MAAARYLGIDMGSRRVGLATGDSDTKLAQALKTVVPADLAAAVAAAAPLDGLVIGLPRGLDGQTTAQTLAVQRWADDLLGDRTEPIYWQDEAGTSGVAEDNLRASGKAYKKEDIDAHAAAIILQDYLNAL